LFSVKHTVVSHLGKWFTASKFARNLDAMNTVQFVVNALQFLYSMH